MQLVNEGKYRALVTQLEYLDKCMMIWTDDDTCLNFADSPGTLADKLGPQVYPDA